MEEKAVQGDFKFKSYLISESQINISNEEKIDKKINLSIGLDAERADSDSIVSLSVDVHDMAKNLQIHVKIRGYFESKNVEEKYRNNFIALNAPAILFPYVRAYISSLTGQAGISPLILPTINLYSHGKKLLQRLEQEGR